MNNKIITIFVICIAIVLFGVGYYAWVTPQQNGEREPDELGTVTEGWVTYKNVEYGFTLSHPEDWTVEITNDFEPYINVYPENSSPNLPLTHHSDSPHVSLFPHGVATEGVRGERVLSNVSFQLDVREANDYVLREGDRFATMAYFENTPESWNEYGFVWAKAQVNNFETFCEMNGERVGMMNCGIPSEPGAEIVRIGDVDQEQRSIQVRILESLKFEM